MLQKDEYVIPRESFVRESKVKDQVIKELVPELLDNLQVIQKINDYIFSDEKKTISRKKLKALMEQHTSKQDHFTLEVLLTVFDGIKRTMTSYGISNYNDLDNWMDIQKEELINFLLKDRKGYSAPPIVSKKHAANK